MGVNQRKLFTIGSFQLFVVLTVLRIQKLIKAAFRRNPPRRKQYARLYHYSLMRLAHINQMQLVKG